MNRNNSSAQWKARGTREGFIRRGLIKSMGYTEEDLEKPIIGIISPWSESNPGHYHFRLLAEAVKRGVWAAGGFPLEVGASSVCDAFVNVSSLIFRNLLAAETEELIKRHPFDAVVLLSSCDKDIPARLMAVASADKPAILLPGGSMLPGYYAGRTLALGTDSFDIWDRHLSREISSEELVNLEECSYGSVGACPIMGTANTMQCMAEALGLAIPGSATPPSLSAERLRIAERTGRTVVRLLEAGIRPSRILTEEAFHNAIAVLMALGGSTNAVIHLIAIARRAGIRLDLSLFDEISRCTPYLVNVKPSGQFTVGIEFYQAGGVPAVMKEIEGSLKLGALTVTGKTVGENLHSVAKSTFREVIAPYASPISKEGGLCVLRGNLAPFGAVIKRSAADPRLLRHMGRAKVFDSVQDARRYILDPYSDMDENTVVVVRGQGPKGGPGMPEIGNSLPVPPKLYRKGFRDYLRITDGRMSGGCYGTVVLHVSPEAAIGGPLAIVQDGDLIRLDVDQRLLNLEITEEELRKRLQSWKPRDDNRSERGYIRHFIERVLQAHEGCDLDYM